MAYFNAPSRHSPTRISLYSARDKNWILSKDKWNTIWEAPMPHCTKLKLVNYCVSYRSLYQVTDRGNRLFRPLPEIIKENKKSHKVNLVSGFDLAVTCEDWLMTNCETMWTRNAFRLREVPNPYLPNNRTGREDSCWFSKPRKLLPTLAKRFYVKVLPQTSWLILNVRVWNVYCTARKKKWKNAHSNEVRINLTTSLDFKVPLLQKKTLQPQCESH